MTVVARSTTHEVDLIMRSNAAIMVLGALLLFTSALDHPRPHNENYHSLVLAVCPPRCRVAYARCDDYCRVVAPYYTSADIGATTSLLAGGT